MNLEVVVQSMKLSGISSIHQQDALMEMCAEQTLAYLDKGIDPPTPWAAA